MAKLDATLEAAKTNFDKFDETVKSLTQDEMNKSPKLELEPVHKIAQIDIDKSPQFYLKPSRSIASKEKFNEKHRPQWQFAKEYVQFIGTHRELIGEKIEIWTKPYPGMPAEFWEVPTGRPVWGPRYLAEQIAKCQYHRLRTENSIQGPSEGGMQFHGGLIVDNIVNRLEATPVNGKRSVFMGAGV